MVDVGSSLHGMYGEYKLKAKLGDGLTGRVFAADHPTEGMEVAVKVLKPNLPVATIRSFMLEARHIAEVSTAVEKWIKRQPTGDVMADQVATPPKFYEMHEATGPDDATFQVMELMQGQQMEERGSLPEAIGLRLGIQLFGLLAVLHEEARRTYTDFKFENLWWEPYGQRLRVTDWNVVSEEGNLTDVALDLERATRALVRVLTGTAMTSGQRLVQQPRWETLSEGARRLFSQALHPDRARRPQSAAEMRKELVRLAGYWQPERPARVLQRVELILDAVEQVGGTITVDPASQQTLLQAVGMLGVLRLRREQEPADDQWPSETVEELNTLWQRSTMLLPTAQTQIEKAKHMLDAGSAPVALDLLRQAALDFPDELAVHRWLAVAETVDQRRPGAGDTALLKQSIELCEQGKYATAQERLIPVAKIVPDTLQQDIDFQLAWNDAIDEKSELKYRLPAADRAAGHLAALKQRSPDYANAVRVNTETDVDKYGDALRQEEAESLRQQRVEKYIAKVGEAIDLKNPTKVISVVEGEFKSFAEDLRAVEVTLDLVESCLRARKYLDAERIYAVGKNLADEAGALFGLGSQVSHACQELSRYRASDRTRKEVDDTITHLLDARADLPIPRLTPMQEALAQAIQDGIVAAAALKRDEAAKAMNDLDAFRAHLRTGELQPVLVRLQGVFAEAIQQDPLAAHKAVSEALSASALVSALTAILDQEPNWNEQERADLRALAMRALKLPKPVEKVLSNTGGLVEAKDEYEVRRALAKSLGLAAKSDLPLQIALAVAAGMPSATAVLEKLLADCDANEKRKLAVVYRSLAEKLEAAKLPPASSGIGDGSALQKEPMASAGESPVVKTKPGTQISSTQPEGVTGQQSAPANVPPVRKSSGAQSPGAAGPTSTPTAAASGAIVTSGERTGETGSTGLSDQDALMDLQSDDPKRWETATTRPAGEQAQWSPQAKELVGERRRTLIDHRREMERAFSLFAASPTTAKETIEKWQRTYSIVSCWAPRENAWVPTDKLLHTVTQVTDTQQAEQWLRQAKDNAGRGKTLEARDSITHALSHFPYASDQVLGELRDLQEGLKPRPQSAGLDSSPESLNGLLKRALEDKKTLTELCKHLSSLSRTYPESSDIFLKQHNSLVPWEQRERWLNEVEQKILSTLGEVKMLPTAAEVQTAKGYLTFLNALRNQPFWSDYVPWDSPVFAKTQLRLERIVRSFDAQWKPEQASHG